MGLRGRWLGPGAAPTEQDFYMQEANVAVALRQMRNVSLDTRTTIGHVPHTPAHGPPTPPAFIHITRVQYVFARQSRLYSLR